MIVVGIYPDIAVDKRVGKFTIRQQNIKDNIYGVLPAVLSPFTEM